MIRIMKASAGSGKTFNLARKYIELLLSMKDRHAYRHILAVTFTNKATDEMKRRIMHELFILADSPYDSGYLDYFVPAMFSDVEGLQKAADEILCNLLHDYSAFSVSTIDRFFQQTLKAFSREIGQFSSYQVELDKDSLISESVDRVLDALTEKDADKLKWLTDSAMEQIEQGGRYNLENELKSIAARIFSDGHREMAEKSGIDVQKSYSREHLAEVRKACTKAIRRFETMLLSAEERIGAILQASGVPPEHFNRGFISRVFITVENGKPVDMPSDSFFSKAADPQKWFPKSRSGLLDKVYPELEAPLNDFCGLFGKPYSVYRTAYIIRGQLYGLGLAGDVNREFLALMKERNVLSIDDSNTILKDIIAGSDAPFIYEKTGVRYDSFLLDEFQDTARIQWENFLPLLQESEGKGCESLVVGDVKQSIYRWRGSDWNLLADELQNAFDNVSVSVLDTNYRSRRNIVEFNNSFFRQAASQLDRIYSAKSGCEGQSHAVSDIYSDVRQECRSSEPGSVDITFSGKELSLQKILDSVNEVREKGAALSDLAVLVRDNASGAAVAGFLIENGIKVITDDSLKVKSSVIVRRLVSLLSYVDNPEDDISGYLSASLDVSIPEEYNSLENLCESLLRELMKNDESLFVSEVLYIQSFMDAVSDYSRLEGNSLRGFLSRWSEMDPAISSPDTGDSVRVMTIHKSKGLDFQYVIVPFVEKITLFKSDCHWCRPDLAGTGLEEPCDGIYDVRLSPDSMHTLFSEDYRDELLRQYIDNINVLYVAFTRARKGMHIIAAMPSDSFIDGMPEDGWPDFSDFSQALYAYTRICRELDMERSVSDDGSERFSIGTIPSDWRHGNSAEDISPLTVSYPSWPLNPEEGEPRLLLSRRQSDFFSESGDAGIDASGRLKGIVLHDILSRVSVPDDLDMAVRQSMLDGSLDIDQAESSRKLLSDRIASAKGRGWFSGLSVVRNEVDVIDTDGTVHRPDRVEIFPDGKVLVIDYKFGKEKPEYASQVSGYADIYRKMGYGDVRAAVWYVIDDYVEEIL